MTSEFRYDRALGSRIQFQSELANKLIWSYFAIQFLAVGLVTPVMTAGAIADEKERRTLEFILATDLRSREIVLGKLAARLANMLLFLIAGLPVLAVLQFLGGVDPGELLVAFAGTLLTLASVASLSILMSVLLRRGRDAILSTFLLMIAYLILSFFSQLAIHTEFSNASVDLGSWTISGAGFDRSHGRRQPVDRPVVAAQPAQRWRRFHRSSARPDSRLRPISWGRDSRLRGLGRDSFAAGGDRPERRRPKAKPAAPPPSAGNRPIPNDLEGGLCRAGPTIAYRPADVDRPAFLGELLAADPDQQ